MKDTMSLIHRIQQILDCYDDTQTECDGMTQICHTILVKYDIEHQSMAGTLARLSSNEKIPIHLWIDLPNGFRIDYRLKMWLGNEVPHGIFNPDNFPDIIYTGEPIELKPLEPIVFAILTTKFGLPS